MIKRKAFSTLTVLLILTMFGCNYFRSDVNKYAVNVKFTNSGGEKLEAVSVIIGADKFWWASIEAGEEKSVNLFSDKNSVNNLTLLYKINGREQTWESPKFEENADYKINLTIDSNGFIDENSCRLPCP